MKVRSIRARSLSLTVNVQTSKQLLQAAQVYGELSSGLGVGIQPCPSLADSQLDYFDQFELVRIL